MFEDYSLDFGRSESSESVSDDKVNKLSHGKRHINYRKEKIHRKMTKKSRKQNRKK